MSNVYVILQIVFITLGITVFSVLFNKFFGLNREESRKVQEKMRNLQDQMKNAQVIGDYQEMKRLQQESMEITKDMMKKQLLPLCIRCIIFFGIYALLGVIYAPYGANLVPFTIPLFGSGWFAIYFLSYLGFSLSFYGIRKLYKKLTGKEDEKRPSFTKEILGFGSQSNEGNLSGFQIPKPTTQKPENKSQIDRSEKQSEKKSRDSQEKKPSWKDRI
jgi:uncharacterized membrane protein (DUF106 family)